MDGLNCLILGKWRVAVRICRETEKSNVTFSVLGKPNSMRATVQRMAILEGLWIIQAKCHDGSLLFLKASLLVQKGTVVFFFLHICDKIDPPVFLLLFQASSFSFSLPLTIITTIMEAMRDVRQKRHTISGIDPHPSPHREKKTWVQGLHNSDWTVRSIGCSISRCHGNSQSKDRAPAFIYTCLLHPATLCKSLPFSLRWFKCHL